MTEEQNNQNLEDLDDSSSQPDSAQAASKDPLEVALEEAAQMKEKWMRSAADFDNYRKRTRREVSDAEKKGRENLLRDLLPVFDNLERATAHGQAGGEMDVQGVKALVEGISLVTRQFHDALSRVGIERIHALGEPFDPSLHEAIQHMETTEVAPGCVAAEVQPGYREGDRLLRPALVVVAKAPVNAGPEGEPNAAPTAEPDKNEDSAPN